MFIRRDWWFGVLLIVAALLFHALFPRYEYANADLGGSDELAVLTALTGQTGQPRAVRWPPVPSGLRMAFMSPSLRFYPDDALKAAGARVEIAKPWTSQVVRDRELITGQNPNSDGQLAEELVKALKAKARVTRALP